MKILRLFPVILGLCTVAAAQDAAPVSANEAIEKAGVLCQQIQEGLKAKEVPADMPLAVVDFNNIGPKCQELKIGETMGEILMDAFVKQGKLKLVDRKNLKKLTHEMALGQSGLIDEETAAQVGNLIGAKLLVTGSVMLMGTNFNVVAKVVNVETSELVASQNALIDRKALIVEAGKIQEINKHPITAGFKSLLIPGWGQIENDQVGKGTVCMIMGGGALLTGLYFNSQASSSYDFYRNAWDDSVGGIFWEDIGYYQELRNYAYIGAGVVWGLSFLDAVFTAWRYNNKLKRGEILESASRTDIDFSADPRMASVQVNMKLSF